MKFSATMTPKSFPMLMKALKNPTAILITHRKCNPEKISEKWTKLRNSLPRRETHVGKTNSSPRCEREAPKKLV
jgi:hypothetical protein